jgi:hypothetical protein
MTKELQLVTFVQAKRLKELGFDWETNTLYELDDFGDTVLLDETTAEDFNGIETYLLGEDRYESNEYLFSAPTVALALKWIRDEKKIPCGVTAGTLGKHFASYHYNKMLAKIITIGGYEAAERALLDELLTILEKKK